MVKHSVSGFGRPAAVLALGIILGSMAGCGGPGEFAGPVSATSCTDPSNASGPSTAYAYITTAGGLYQYAVGSDGSLQLLSVAAVPIGAQPTAIVSDPTGHYVYVANQQDATIWQYSVGAGGGLMPLSPAVVADPVAGSGYSLSIDPQGRFLYLVIDPPSAFSGSSLIAQYSVGSDGTLTPVDPASVNVLARASGPLAIDCSGRYAYLAANSGGDAANQGAGEVVQFSIGAQGALSPLQPASVAATATAIGVALAPSGRTAYVLSDCVDTNCNGQAALYSIGPDGNLASTGVITALPGTHVNPVGMLINQSGTSAYLLTDFGGIDSYLGSVYQYAVGSSGELTPYQPSSVTTSSNALAETLYGSNLYVVGAAGAIIRPGGSVNHYVIGADGRLSPVSTITFDEIAPTAMTVVVPR